MKSKYKAYAVATETVAKTKQIVLLYDGVIRLVQQAQEAIRDKRIEERYHLLIKASDVIFGLQSCLDFERGGEISRILYSYYSSLSTRLFAIHRSNSIEACDVIIQDLKQMRDVWVEIDKNEAGDSPAVPTPAPEGDTAAAVSPLGDISLSA